MKNILIIAILISLGSCSNTAQQHEEHVQDSIEQTEIDQVDEMLLNEDSLLKAKEKELLEKYGN
ncbi:MAG: hypothetical protein R2852_09190 [Bacteroidia bacterium]